jgi:glutathione S-transferase
MILIGQFDSPYVRRVGVAMRYYDIAFEHRPWSTFGDADKIAVYNPLLRVPVLVLDDGEALLESGAVLDYLDEVAGGERALIAASGPQRRRCLRLCALATGLADKAVAMVYSRAMHKEASPEWRARCAGQLTAGFAALEKELAAVSGAYFFGDDITHADIAAVCALRFIAEAHPGLIDMKRYPSLAVLSSWCEALPVFRETAQTFLPPPPAP